MTSLLLRSLSPPPQARAISACVREIYSASPADVDPTVYATRNLTLKKNV